MQAIDSDQRDPDAGAATAAAPPTTDSGRTGDARARRRDRLLLSLGAAAWLAGLSMRTPLGSEIRYIEAAREMVETGDRVVPHLAYVPYFEKPILLYWLDAAAQAAFGGSPVAARLPSILAGALLIAVVHAFGCRLGGRRAGAATAGLCTGSAFFVAGSVLTTDMVFSTLLVAAWYALHRRLAGGGGRWLLAAWAGLGLAVLTKGPLALILTGGGATLFALMTRDVGSLRRSRPVAGLALVLAINLPWAWLVWRWDPRAIEFFLVRENFRAFFDGTVNHSPPAAYAPVYYLLIAVAGFLPWSLPALAAAATAVGDAVRDARRRWASPRAETVAADPAADLRSYLVAMAAFTLLFLSVSASKLPLYALPACPVIAVLAVDGLRRRCADPRLRRLALIHGWVGAAAVLGAAAAFPFLASGQFAAFDRAWTVPVVAALALIAGAPLVAARWCRRGDWGRGFAIAGAIAACGIGLGDVVAGRCLIDIDSRRLAGIVSRLAAPEDDVVVSARSVQDFSIVATLRRRLRYIGTLRELGLGHFLEATPPTTPLPADPTRLSAAALPGDRWLLSDADLRAAWSGPRRIWLFTAPKEATAMRQAGLAVDEIAATPDAVLVTNAPVGAADADRAAAARDR